MGMRNSATGLVRPHRYSVTCKTSPVPQSDGLKFQTLQNSSKGGFRQVRRPTLPLCCVELGCANSVPHAIMRVWIRVGLESAR